MDSFDQFDFPESKLQIPLVKDLERPELDAVPAVLITEYYGLDAIAQMRVSARNRFRCYFCDEPVQLTARLKKQDGVAGIPLNAMNSHLYFFKHRRGCGQHCQWKSDNSNRALVYKGIKEGGRHRALKTLISETLRQLPNWSVIAVDDRFIFSPDRRQRGKPDILAKYKGRHVVFEIQLRSESPEIIGRRQQLYKDMGYQLMWICSFDSVAVAQEEMKIDAEIRQVHKDIGFNSRGNLFVFNEELQKLTVIASELQLIVAYFKPRLSNGKITFSFETERASFSQIRYEDGDSFLKDYHEELEEMRACSYLEAREKAKEYLSNNWMKGLDSVEDFYTLAKNYWYPEPMLSESEKNVLKEIYDDKYVESVIKLKRIVHSLCLSGSMHEIEIISRWREIEDQLKDKGFGFYSGMNVNILRNGIRLLGYDILGNRMKESEYQEAYLYFYFNLKARHYTSLCERISENGPYPDVINNDYQKNIQHDAAYRYVKQHYDLDEFFDWFMSYPFVYPKLERVVKVMPTEF
ncbi:hypothetical protein HCH_06387 [Hahella chejuensis KCTC 2396]|uniref:DUF6035 domain-containing protein n=1 Tax=Hahella chejuensis (strain KCTC 2396) TaxID=349521 RepID=Q2S8J2_HAHCH|nr:DUF6035 family protein [Hahella chejuensis]ABC33032.1 hypothetical protein HCH_06387 [Hahella chejuensis KCTC 2396]